MMNQLWHKMNRNRMVSKSHRRRFMSHKMMSKSHRRRFMSHRMMANLHRRMSMPHRMIAQCSNKRMYMIHQLFFR